jgi:hypothetical protein
MCWFGLFDGHVIKFISFEFKREWPMHQVEIDIIGLKICQGPVQSRSHVLRLMEIVP